MTTALEGGEWSAARPGRNLPPGKTRYPLYRRLGWPRGRSGRAENLVHTGIRTRTVQPVVNHYTDWATRPTVDKSTLAKLRSSHIASTASSMCSLCSQLRGGSSLQYSTMKFLHELRCPCWWLRCTASYSRYSNPTTQQYSNTLCFRWNKVKQLCSPSSLLTRFLILRPPAGTYPRIPTCTGIYMAQCMFLFIVVPSMVQVNLSSWEDLFWMTQCLVVPLDWKTG